VPIKIVNKLRFNEDHVDATGMREIGNSFIASQDARLSQALNVRDQPAKPLKSAYARAKAAKGKKPIRDWFLSGLTRLSIQVLQAIQNRVVIGSGNPTGDLRIRVNNRREKQFGVSPKDLENIKAAVKRVVVVGRVESRG
jgi:hypothetical protein